MEIGYMRESLENQAVLQAEGSVGVFSLNPEPYSS